MTTSTASPETEVPVVKVGDFFSASWGYDQTNVDFYKVVGVTPSGKSVKVQKWTSASVHDDGGPTTYVAAGGGPAQEFGGCLPGEEGLPYYERTPVYKDAPVMTKRLRLGGYKGASFTVASYASAYLWDGKAQYETGGGWGH